MAKLKFGDWDVTTNGSLPTIGSIAPEFELVRNDLSRARLSDYKGVNIILDIFTSIDTGTCQKTVRFFNEAASKLENTIVLGISRDLPFAMKRFCGAEGIEKVETLSDFIDGSFAKDYGVYYIDSPIKGLCSRALIVLDEDKRVVYTEHVPDGSKEPNYEQALDSLIALQH